MNCPGGLEGFAVWAYIYVAIFIKGKVVTREAAIVSAGFIPDRNVWIDTMLDQPAKHLPVTIPCETIAGKGVLGILDMQYYLGQKISMKLVTLQTKKYYFCS